MPLDSRRDFFAQYLLNTGNTEWYISSPKVKAHSPSYCGTLFLGGLASHTSVGGSPAHSHADWHILAVLPFNGWCRNRMKELNSSRLQAGRKVGLFLWSWSSLQHNNSGLEILNFAHQHFRRFPYVYFSELQLIYMFHKYSKFTGTTWLPVNDTNLPTPPVQQLQWFVSVCEYKWDKHFRGLHPVMVLPLPCCRKPGSKISSNGSRKSLLYEHWIDQFHSVPSSPPPQPSANWS